MTAIVRTVTTTHSNRILDTKNSHHATELVLKNTNFVH